MPGNEYRPCLSLQVVFGLVITVYVKGTFERKIRKNRLELYWLWEQVLEIFMYTIPLWIVNLSLVYAYLYYYGPITGIIVRLSLYFISVMISLIYFCGVSCILNNMTQDSISKLIQEIYTAMTRDHIARSHMENCYKVIYKVHTLNRPPLDVCRLLTDGDKIRHDLSKEVLNTIINSFYSMPLAQYLECIEDRSWHMPDFDTVIFRK